IGCDDDFCGFAAGSQARAVLASGQQVRVRVAGWGQADEGQTSLEVTQGVVPANDLCANAVPLTVGSAVAFDNSCSGTEGAASCGFGGDAGSNDIWFSFNAPSTGLFRIDTCQSGGLDTILNVYDSCGGSEIACNDDACGLSSAVTINAVQGTTYLVRLAGWNGTQGAGQINVAVPAANDLCSGATPVVIGSTNFDTSTAANDDATNCGGSGPELFYSFTPAASGGYQIDTIGSGFDTILAVLEADCVTELVCNDDNGTLQSTVSTFLAGGTTYIIQVDGFGGAFGAGVLNINGPIAGPANDLCANATAATIGSNPFDNRFAGNEGAASCGFNGDPGSADVWFSFVAPASEVYRFDTCQSAGLDTIVSIYDTCGGSEIACNDDSCGLSSAVTFNTTQGTTYYIRVAGWAGAQGAGALNISSPLANDVCATASPAALGSNPFDTSAAANDDATNCGGSGPDIFFTFAPTQTGGYQFSTCNGTGYDSILAILSSDCVTELACNDDACGLQSTVVANLTAGTTYIVQVDGFGGGFGAGNLEITFLGGGGGNNYTVCDSSHAFEDISSTGTLAATISGCDDCTESLPIGFSFDFYGTAFTDVQASSNGLVAFGTPSAVFGNVAIPNAATPNSFATALWDDLYPTGAGDIYYQTTGSAGSRVFTVSWQGVAPFPTTNPEYNFQVLLYEGSNNIEYRYGSITPDAGGDYSVGCEDATGLNGTAINSADLGSGNIAKFLIPAGGTCPQDCDSIDWNGDGLFPDIQDIADFIFVFGGGTCPTGTCNDLDYNNDTLLPDTTDIQALVSVFGGGPCIR
ncbi:MAG TPA: hypothetical protein VHN77_06790, partial [Phycisphaerales bacterium]|nr:hypothetical protein [Phycisphaerales bacterium]